jgi:pimeloyl-ACP methyl ester carboxylesterase
MAGMLDSVRPMRFVVESRRRVAVHLGGRGPFWPTPDAVRAEEERVVVFCHGAPGAGGFDPDPAQTLARDVRLLSVDRPGYGRSDPVAAGQWATVASAADDIAVVLDSLDVDRVGVVGWAAGGRVALALAARRPDLVDRVVVVATPAPDEEVPWMGPDQRSALERLRTMRAEEAHAELGSHLRSLTPADPFYGDAVWLIAAATSDDPVLRSPGARDRLGEMLRGAFAQGADGLAADIAGYSLRPWGFTPDQVRAPTLLLYGSHDPLAGSSHGRWWLDRITDARLEVVPGAGHLLVIPTWARALSHLAPGGRHLHAVAGHGDPLRPTGGFEEFSAA